MRDYTLETVDQWIALTPKEAQPKIKELRAVILSAVPDIEEGISWGQPYYRKDGLLAGFDVFKEYVSFGFGPSFESEFRAKLEAKGYKTGGKTIQIRFDQAVPAAEVQEVLRTKAKANKAKKAAQ